MRKSAVSQIHTNHEEMSGELADLMTHRIETARKYYRVADRKRIAISASTKQAQIMKNPAEKKRLLQDQEKKVNHSAVSTNDLKQASQSKDSVNWTSYSEEHNVNVLDRIDYAQKNY